MHTNSVLLFQKYALAQFQPNDVVLEVGPDQESTYRRLLTVPADYHFCDMANWGENTPGFVRTLGEYKIDSPDQAYDVVFTGQVIEHVRKVWLWVEELARITRRVLIIIGPISWEYHLAPCDCWRIYPEGMRALLEDTGLTCELSQFESLDSAVTDTITIATRI